MNRRVVAAGPRELIAGALFLLLLGTAAPVAHAFVSSYISPAGQYQKWNLVNLNPSVYPNVLNRNTRALRYFLAADAYSQVNRTNELNAARACFAQWQAAPGSIVKFEEGGLFSGKADINTQDHTNLVFWAKTSTIVNGGLDQISGTVGLTFTDFLSDGTLLEADIVLNGVEYTWFTDYFNTASGSRFVEAILLHEIGHFLGLAHSPIGAATMFPRDGGGVSTEAGLSTDELCALHTLYPQATVPATLGAITGQVTMNALPVPAAIVVAEDSAGNVVAGTVTQTNGTYQLPGLPPGSYQLRTTPVDPPSARYFLFRGGDALADFSAAQGNFLASSNVPVTVVAGQTAARSFVVGGTPTFRITHVWPSGAPFLGNFGMQVDPAQGAFTMNIYSPAVPPTNALLRLTGDGLAFGDTSIKLDVIPGAIPALNAISVPVQIAPNATPGMRSVVVHSDSADVYANGFVEVAPPFPDFNFDGLDDRFQRRYFPLWTAPEAAPDADPDQDHYNNYAEFISGTDPTDPNSVLEVQSVHLDASGATVTWPSAPGKRYQLFRRPQISSSRGWEAVGNPVVSTGTATQAIDTAANNVLQFYRIEALP